MKTFNPILNILAIIFGGLLLLLDIKGMSKNLIGLIAGTHSYTLGYEIGYLAGSLLFGCGFVWLLLKGLSFFKKPKPEEKAKE
jgi:hypothetical protein